MHKVRARDFGLTCQSNFATPKPYAEEVVRDFVSTAIREFTSYGVGANSFVKNEGDRLFNYGISLSLLNGNAAFLLGRDGLLSSLAGGQNERDAELIRQLLTRAHRCLPELEKVTHRMTAFCHAEFTEGDELGKLFQELVVVKAGVKAVAVSVLGNDASDLMLAPDDRLRLDVAPSELKEGRLFMAWRFSARGAIPDDYWAAIAPRFKAIAGSLGIELV